MQEAEPEVPRTAAEQRTRAARSNRGLALILVSGAAAMLAAAFGVAVLVAYGHV